MAGAAKTAAPAGALAGVRVGAGVIVCVGRGVSGCAVGNEAITVAACAATTVASTVGEAWPPHAVSNSNKQAAASEGLAIALIIASAK
jgi:hypothetical protein